MIPDARRQPCETSPKTPCTRPKGLAQGGAFENTTASENTPGGVFQLASDPVTLQHTKTKCGTIRSLHRADTTKHMELHHATRIMPPHPRKAKATGTHTRLKRPHHLAIILVGFERLPLQRVLGEIIVTDFHALLGPKCPAYQVIVNAS